MNRRFVEGALYISIATILSRLIGSFFRVPLQNIAGNEVLGIYTLIYPVYMTTLTLAVAGIPLTISKLIAEARANGNEQEIYYIFRTANILAVLLGSLSFSIIFLFSETLATVLGGQHVRIPLIILTSSLVIAPYMAIYRGFFQGFEQMQPTAISQIIEQFVRVVFILCIAFILVNQNMSVENIVSGVMIGSVISVIVSLFYLKLKWKKAKLLQQITLGFQFAQLSRWAKRIITLSIPICIGTLTFTIIFVVDSFTVPTQLIKIGFEKEIVTDLYGYYGRGLVLIQIPVVLAQSLILPMIPAVSSNTLNSQQITEKVLYFMHLTAWPISMGIFALTAPLNYALFGDFNENVLIAVTHLSALFITFSVLTTGILQANNRSVQVAIVLICCSILKGILNLLLIPFLGLLGAAIATVVVYMGLSILNTWVIKKHLSIQIWTRNYTVFSCSAIVMAMMISVPFQLLFHYTWTRIETVFYLTGITLCGAVIYCILITLFKGITNKELSCIPIIRKHITVSK
ncbi:hypothetical protein BKP37_11030 [Anaerobacillus alkalilacustris]|uniref:Uncharacterized protein n=1 Tax=Anaerobacillus alkalilacustris TaxID=393763 RepID=A0A1S2LL29_9BACI|nr:polysaccharide biosynthesis protein [Anaerobacillus alkalilacustris]OIJ13044.1 hypothetical protein BKP37_11030 [Anaerobacillus alkalilacustris]